MPGRDRRRAPSTPARSRRSASTRRRPAGRSTRSRTPRTGGNASCHQATGAPGSGVGGGTRVGAGDGEGGTVAVADGVAPGVGVATRDGVATAAGDDAGPRAPLPARTATAATAANTTTATATSAGGGRRRPVRSGGSSASTPAEAPGAGEPTSVAAPESTGAGASAPGAPAAVTAPTGGAGSTSSTPNSRIAEPGRSTERTAIPTSTMPAGPSGPSGGRSRMVARASVPGDRSSVDGSTTAQAAASPSTSTASRSGDGPSLRSASVKTASCPEATRCVGSTSSATTDGVADDVGVASRGAPGSGGAAVGLGVSAARQVAQRVAPPSFSPPHRSQITTRQPHAPPGVAPRPPRRVYGRCRSVGRPRPGPAVLGRSARRSVGRPGGRPAAGRGVARRLAVGGRQRHLGSPLRWVARSRDCVAGIEPRGSSLTNALAVGDGCGPVARPPRVHSRGAGTMPATTRSSARHAPCPRGGLSSIGRASDCGSEGYGFKPRRPPHRPA